MCSTTNNKLKKTNKQKQKKIQPFTNDCLNVFQSSLKLMIEMNYPKANKSRSLHLILDMYF